ncbi:hypothetical protein [Archaeoglobus profundus]|uniref:GAT domain-containing protein n=1 Tax=Archaeoglobus profundus (strain DSM 5631 / JCM 9629 / NBRC 100127 / Av18) TaxID=572546 RepID=D2RI21_ARCPA|nr:hypothetical protein [Archaeoglobus profundus]ADB57946.1 hypothetical protein Arcpr_0883 [Archaeoglobus profundus DSM 5631]
MRWLALVMVVLLVMPTAMAKMSLSVSEQGHMGVNAGEQGYMGVNAGGHGHVNMSVGYGHMNVNVSAGVEANGSTSTVSTGGTVEGSVSINNNTVTVGVKERHEINVGGSTTTPTSGKVRYEHEYRHKVSIKEENWIKNREERIRHINEIRHEIKKKIRERLEEFKKKFVHIEEKREARKKNMVNSMKMYEEYRNLYLKMGLNSKEGFKYAKHFVYHGGYACINFFMLIRSDIEMSNLPNKDEILQEIDSYISALEEKINAINNSTSPEELRSATRELRDLWNEIKPKIRLYTQLTIVAKLENVLDRAEMIGMNLTATVQDYNVSELEDLLSEYFAHIDNARNYLNEAVERIESGEDAMDYIMEARAEINEAFMVLKDIYRELFKVRAQPLSLGNRTGEFWVRMSGYSDVSGKCIVHIKGNATVVVTPKSAVITTVGFEKVSENNETVTYSGTGNIVVKGNVTVSVEGNYTMFVKGVANIYLDGEGVYKVKPLPEEKMGEFELSGEETIAIGE